MQVIDLFAGGGGASHGIELALGCSPSLAINHDPAAIEMHAANHPDSIHLTEDLFRVRPFKPHRGAVDLLWASPDCTHHSRAKGGKPRESGRRLLAWVVVEWAREVNPRVICLENVQEFRDWGPLDDAGQPIRSRKGETFREFVSALQLAGYRVEHAVLNAADYGAPTARKRLFLVARRDGIPVRWPEPTHGPERALPWRTAAECIDWSIPVPSIFDRARPLAEATQRRIAEGIRRYVLTAAKPFLVQTGYGERAGQAPRVLDIDAPLGTVVAGGQKHALVAAFLAKHYGGMVGQPLDRPMGTVTAVDHHSLVAATIVGTGGRAGQSPPRPMDRPMGTTKADAALVAAFLTKFYGTGIGGSLAAPLDTVTTLDRFGLVTVQIDGEPYAICDIGMRMLQPRELATAQGFGPDYILTGSKREQVARIGNSVCPPVAAALVAAQFGVRPRLEAA
jgi:DNA (cytosine-5)-methyltransferase 1